MEDRLHFFFGNTPPNNLIGASFEQYGVIPKITFHIMDEFLLLMIEKVRGQHFASEIVDKINVPRKICLNTKELFIREGFLNTGAFDSFLEFKSRKMIRNDIFTTLLVTNL